MMTLKDLPTVLAAHKLWLSGDPKGKRADLRDADLYGADLRCASLRGADLRDADLSGACLRCADLRGANLRGANLRGADLRRVNLCRVDLRGADLRGVDLRWAEMPDTDFRGARVTDTQTYEEYHEHLPELLTAGGRSVAEVAQAWNCHSWDNCPMAMAFGVHGIGDVPEAWRPRAQEFVWLFDSGLVKKPTVSTVEAIKNVKAAES